MNKALLIIDLQNDCFPGGAFPLWNTEKYKVSILTDCCTTVSQLLHLIALHAVSTRVPLVSSKDVI